MQQFFTFLFFWSFCLCSSVKGFILLTCRQRALTTVSPVGRTMWVYSYCVRYVVQAPEEIKLLRDKSRTLIEAVTLCLCSGCSREL